MVLDIDSTLVEVHSENKAQAAAHFKGGFGFHPMLCVTDDGEPLSMMLRPGNAAANSISDHIEVLDAAVAQLPAGRVGGGTAKATTQRRRVGGCSCVLILRAVPHISPRLAGPATSSSS